MLVENIQAYRNKMSEIKDVIKRSNVTLGTFNGVAVADGTEAEKTAAQDAMFASIFAGYAAEIETLAGELKIIVDATEAIGGDE